MKDKALNEMSQVKSPKNKMVLPSEGSKGTKDRGGLVISAAARKKILEMALGQSVSTFLNSIS